MIATLTNKQYNNNLITSLFGLDNKVALTA